MDVSAANQPKEEDSPAGHQSHIRWFSSRANKWQLADRTLEFDRIPRLMGIVNVTPDSFSDGGNFFAADAAFDHAMQMATDGADILDIGGESTRPYSEPVSAQEELRRVIPVIRRLAESTPIPISIDTSKAEVAREAVAAGATIINDVTGLEGDPDMLTVAADTAAGVCAMHMQGNPQTMQDDPAYTDVVREIRQYLGDRRDNLLKAGIAAARICLDPGIGFGKTHKHNLALLSCVGEFHELQCPLLVGHSRKGFLAKILRDKNADRTSVTVGVALALASAGVQVIRIHDVRPLREALLGFAAAGGIGMKV